jgi:hypothetical protein
MKENNASDIPIEKAMCKNCTYNIKRPDMKNIHYCVKRNFAILNQDQYCRKYIRRKKYE